MKRVQVVSLSIATLAIGCGGRETAPPSELKDVRTEIPAPDPRFLDIVTPEVMIDSGDDRTYCYHYDLQSTGGELAVRNLEALQGRGGHHLILLATTRPQPHGTLEDCTDRATMRYVRPLVLPIDLPEGGGVSLGEGGHVVVQFHYINTNLVPILVRDVARLDLVNPSDVKEWYAPLSTNDALFNLAAKGTEYVAFDCAAERDLSVFLLGGHMHEWGTRFEMLIGPDADHLESLYVVDPWRAEFRDAPPVTLFRDAPLPLAKGTLVRTICEWSNDSDEDLQFPNEMCAGFGYVIGTKSPWLCDTGGISEDTGGFVARYTR